MGLAPPEQLLGLLVESPDGIPRPSPTSSGGGASLHAARTTLEARQHSIEDMDDVWRLACASQHFSPARFERARTSQIGRTFEVWESTRSTNELARAGALGERAEGTLWLAEEQSKGRGRQARVWSSPPHAGLLFSFLLCPDLQGAERAALLPLALALGACEGARRNTALDIRLKWPNDLMLERRKLAGMLVEARHAAPAHVAVGVGINVTTPDAAFERHGVFNATSLHAGGARGVQREALLAAVLEGCERRYDEWRSGAWSRILADWRQYDVLAGSTVRVQTGADALTGRALGIAANGCLQVAMSGGATREFSAGEVHLL